MCAEREAVAFGSCCLISSPLTIKTNVMHSYTPLAVKGIKMPSAI